MTRDTLIKQTIEKLKKLPDKKLKQLSDFADFLLSKIEDRDIVERIQKIVSDSKTFNFLEEEKELYSTKDLKEKYK